MEFIKQDFFPNDMTESQETYFDIPYQEETVHQDIIPSYLPMFYDYRQLERHMFDGPSDGNQWEWAEWNERQVLVKVEADLDAGGATSSFSEEGEKLYYFVVSSKCVGNVNIFDKVPIGKLFRR